MRRLVRWLLTAPCRPTRPARLRFEPLEDRVVPDGRPLPLPTVYAGAGAGAPPTVKIFDADTGALTFEVTAYEPAFTGGVHVAAADFNADAVPDLVTGPGPGGGPRIRVFDGKTGTQLGTPVGNFLAYHPLFFGGIEVAAGDVDGDRVPDVITAAGKGGGPHVKVFSGKTGEVLANFFAFDPDFRGGLHVAAADLTGDGRAEVLVGAGPGGGPHVRAYDLAGAKPAVAAGPASDFFAYDPAYRGGVWVGAGDINGDGQVDVITGPGKDHAPRVKVFNGADGTTMSDFAAFGDEVTGGVRVGSAWVDQDAYADVVAGTGPGSPARVRAFSAGTGQPVAGPLADFAPFGPGELGGVHVAAANDPGTVGVGVGFTFSPAISTWASGQTVSITATVAGDPPPAPAPTGTVLMDVVYATPGPDPNNGKHITLGTPTLVPVGGGVSVATLIVTFPMPPGQQFAFGFNYSGDDYYGSHGSGSGIWGAKTPTLTGIECPPVGDLPPAIMGDPQGGRAPTKGDGGVRVKDGAFTVGRSDFTGTMGGTPWGVGWSWSNAAGYSDGRAGEGSVGGAGGRLVQVNGTDSLALVTSAASATFFDKYDGAYHARYGDRTAFAADAANGVYTATAPDGTVATLYDFSAGTPTGRAGALKSVADPGGGLTQVTSWDGSGRPTEVQRTAGSGGSAVTESLVYAYVSGGVNDGRLASTTLRRQVGGGGWSTVRVAEHTYYDGTGSNGLAGDLKTAVVKDAAGAVLDTSYYRYYTASSATGYAHGLKYAFGPAAYAQMTAALGTNVDSLADTAVDDYADHYLEYDSSKRVTKHTAAGEGCSACTGGQGTYTYTYTTRTLDGLHNAWKVKTVETLPDLNTNTYYANAAGEIMLKVYKDVTTSQEWPTYYRYDTAGRVVLEALPSAVSGYSDTYGDLLNDQGGNLQYLSDTAGLVTAYEYAAATTATTSTAGDAAGHLKGVSIRQGETATAVPQQGATYLKRTAGGTDLFVPASQTVYRNDNGTGGQTTTYSYAWQGTTGQPESVTTTLPTVTTAQNGPGTAATSTVVYDAFGRPIWAKDAGGFLNYVEYDAATGAVTKSIADVDTDLTSDFANLPGGWSNSTGLHLKSTYEVDALGRATKATDPAGHVTYTVFDDDNFEVRTYRGWDSTTNLPTGPTEVVREDRANRYTETLTMSATSTVSSGRPTGTESVGSIQSLSRSYRNAAGQTTYADAYFNLSGLTYTTATSLGTLNTHFYRTTQDYDQQGRPNRTVSPAGTIYRTVIDGQGRAVSEWVGTDDTPTTGFWSPTNLAGTDVVKVREYEYDGGGVGDSNRTKVTDIPGLSTANRVTQTWYDWRNRPVLVKGGVEGSEGTSINRPLTYAEYDNLGQVVASELYDGDAVTVTTTSGVPNRPSSSLLRAKSTAEYDEWGRAFRSKTYSVDPSTGSVSTDALTTNTWFDIRGNVIKTSSPGGLVQKVAYDGVGRATTVYVTDGGGDSGYSDADDVTGDAVLEQAETEYDANSNPILVTTRQRFHDEADTGALGTPTAGVNARVSYSASYYDLADRLTASVDVGTNGGAAWTRPSAVPAVPAAASALSVAGFESPSVGTGTSAYQYAPTGTAWTYTGGGGVAGNASAFTSGNPDAPEGTQVGFLQDTGAAVQTVTAAAGTYAVTFRVAQRGNHQPGGPQTVRVRVDGVEVGAVTPAGTAYQEYTTPGFTLTAGSHTVTLEGTVSTGDSTAFVDAVAVAPAALVTGRTYDAAGRLWKVTDPKGLEGRTEYDALGRTTKTVENYVDGTVGDDNDKTTEYGYGPAGMTSLTAKLTGGGVQTTEWVYGVTQGGGSAIASNDVVGTTKWPDPSTGAASTSEQETVTVNALGQTATSTDRNGNVHTLTYDVLGRVMVDAVTTLGTGVDGAVRRIETAYDGQGNPYLVTNYDAASSGNVVNQVKREFNGLRQLTSEWQEHAGAATGSSLRVQYAYTLMTGGANHSRLTSVTYPNGKVLTYNYSTGLNSNISRLSSLSDTSGTLESYDYLGHGTVVRRAHSQPGVDLTYIKQGAEGTGDAGDQYTGLDRFDRVVDQRWVKISDGSHTDRFQYGYDRNSNRTYRDNRVNTAFGEVYTYDGLKQLASFQRGTLNGTKDGITGTVSRSQSWDYEALGNWDSVTTDGSGQTRTHNKQNEVLTVSGVTSPTFDANGNMTKDETGKQFVYDAWNRLKVVKDAGGATLKTYTYDGLSRRASETSSGTTTDLYYSDQWQVLEERVGGVVNFQYIWSPEYVDALVLRDRDADGNSGNGLEERLWGQQDANWNVTALLNSSGAVQERFTFDPFGMSQVRDEAWNVRPSSDFLWLNRHQGLRLDLASGKYWNRWREYDAALGRFAQIDPLFFAGHDINLYRYESNRATMALDPMGLRCSTCGISNHAHVAVRAFRPPPGPVRGPGPRMPRGPIERIPDLIRPITPIVRPVLGAVGAGARCLLGVGRQLVLGGGGGPPVPPAPPDTPPPPPRETCKSSPLTSMLVLCRDLPWDYMHEDADSACPPGSRAVNGVLADDGPCSGFGQGGMHYRCDGIRGGFTGKTVGCCKCCEDTDKGFKVRTLCTSIP